jgi:hypothetical protein
LILLPVVPMMPHIIYILIQLAGSTSLVSVLLFFVLNHLEGPITILSGFVDNHAPHQLNVLLAIMWCLQRLIRRRSSNAVLSSFQSIYVVSKGKIMLSRTQFISSEKTKS